MTFWLRLGWAYLASLRRGDWLGILLAVIVLGAAAVLWRGAGSLRPSRNFGFGPDWHCTNVGRGEPLCFKDSENPRPR